MANKRILLDIDGVFANFIERSLATVRRLFDKHHDVQHEDIKIYKMEDLLGLSADEKAAWLAEIRSPGWCAGIPTYTGAFECVKRLKALGDVHPVTFPFPGSPWWILEREEWLRDQLGLDPGLAVYTSQKHLIAGDVLVEDTTAHCTKWVEHHPDGVAIRMRRPYNDAEPFLHGSTVRSFDELVETVEIAFELRERIAR